MSYLINNQQKVNEIIFADRNKSYGAYVIRSAYGNTIFKALSIMFFGFGSLMSVAFYLSNRNGLPEEKKTQMPARDSSMVTIFNLKKDEYKKEEKFEKKQQPKTAAEPENKGKVIVTDSVIAEKTTQLNIENKTTVATTLTGTDGSLISTEIGGGGNKTTGGNEINDDFRVDSGPEYEGGLPALYKFVSSHLKYPVIASEMGKEGTVFVKFVVDEKGKVSNLSLLNNIGYGLDQEALRVVALIPNFIKPAMVSGEAVKVYYQLPIKFTMGK